MASPSRGNGLYQIDGNDWYGVYGFAVSAGSDDLLKPPDVKDTLQNDWQDQNGLEMDTSVIYFKNKTIGIEGVLLADNEADYWTKYTAMFNMLAQPGLREVICNELSPDDLDSPRTFYLRYSACSSFSRLTRLKGPDGTNQVGCAMNLTFIEPLPMLVSVSPPPETVGGTIPVEYNDPHLSMVGDVQNYTLPKYLAGKNNYRIWSTQMGVYFRTEDINYDIAGSFAINIPGFVLAEGEQLIIFPYVLNTE